MYLGRSAARPPRFARESARPPFEGCASCLPSSRRDWRARHAQVEIARLPRSSVRCGRWAAPRGSFSTADGAPPAGKLRAGRERLACPAERIFGTILDQEPAEGSSDFSRRFQTREMGRRARKAAPLGGRRLGAARTRHSIDLVHAGGAGGRRDDVLSRHPPPGNVRVVLQRGRRS